MQTKVRREHFIFKLIPMLNPDGVINGNYRCNLAGVDLNRRWSKPSSVWHPTIFSLKDMISKLQSTRGVIMYCDLHGHSRKKNIFMYACCPTSTHKSLLPKGVIQPSKSDRENYIGARRDARLFAYIMAHVKGGGGSPHQSKRQVFSVREHRGRRGRRHNPERVFEAEDRSIAEKPRSPANVQPRIRLHPLHVG